jgi:hypothetical protein
MIAHESRSKTLPQHKCFAKSKELTNAKEFGVYVVLKGNARQLRGLFGFHIIVKGNAGKEQAMKSLLFSSYWLEILNYQLGNGYNFSSILGVGIVVVVVGGFRLRPFEGIREPILLAGQRVSAWG